MDLSICVGIHVVHKLDAFQTKCFRSIPEVGLSNDMGVPFGAGMTVSQSWRCSLGNAVCTALNCNRDALHTFINVREDTMPLHHSE